MCRVSVVISSYNAEKYIVRAIESIQNQTFQDFEIIVCDDCSIDNTVDIIHEMMRIDNRIILLKNSVNMRAAATRNKCIEVAKGEFIAIQDADDYSHITRLEEQVLFLDNNLAYDFVSSMMSRFDKDGIYNTSILKKSSPENSDFLSGVPYAHAPTMFRKSAICSVNGYRVSKQTVRVEDADLFFRLHASGNRGFNLDRSLYYYYEGEEAYKRKKFNYRFNSMVIRYKGYKALNLLPMGYIYIFKPVLVGLIPLKLLMWYKKFKK